MTDAVGVELSVVASAELSAVQRAMVIEVCNAANGHDGFWELFDLVPSDGRHVLLHEEGELVSHAVVTTRWLQVGDGPFLRTGYVDAVATRPDRQHRGHGAAVMATLAGSIADYEIGALQTDLRGFYEPLGWQPWRGPLAGRSDEGLIPTPTQEGVMVLPTPRTPDLDLEALLTIERQPKRIWE